MKLRTCIASVSILTFLLFSINSDAQPWKRNRKELTLGLGATAFWGDLGGLDKIGTDYSPVDIEFSKTRPLIGVGMRYQVSEWSKLKGNLAFGQLAGDDKLTSEIYRNNRNLHFRSPIIELAGIYEIYFNKEKAGHRYNIRQAKGFKIKNFTYYGFVGIAGIFFNPKAQAPSGKWTALQPLGTEGQGLLPGTKKYSRINVALPVGLGLNYSLNRQWKVGLDVGYRKTFTDYIDDVSGRYVDNTLLREHYVANGIDQDLAKLADPNLGLIVSDYDSNGYYSGLKPGMTDQEITPRPLRGQPEKDAYFFAFFTVSYKIITFGSRAKF